MNVLYIISGLLCVVSIYLIILYFRLLKVENIVIPLSGNSSPSFPVRTYQLILNGAGTNNSHLSLYKKRPENETVQNDADHLKRDVINGFITQVMIQGHPYNLKYQSESKYFMNFGIAGECARFPFPECSKREVIDNIRTSVIHAIGYRPIK